MFGYFLFMRELRKLEIRNVKDVISLIQEKEAVQKKLITITNEYEKKLSEAVIKKENEIMSLHHGIDLEKKRLLHELKLAKEEVAAERERVLLELRNQIQKERHEFMEKNFSDLKETTSINFDRTVKAIDMFLNKLPEYRHKRIEGPKGSINVDIEKDNG